MNYTNKQKLTFNTIMERLVIWGTVFFVLFMLFRKDILEHNIKTEANIKYNQYISNYIKNNPDMIPLINKQYNCSKGNIYAVEGCGAYIYKDTTIEQRTRLYEYNRELDKIIEETSQKLKD